MYGGASKQLVVMYVAKQKGRNDMMTHIMLITYSFDSDYVSIPCPSEEEAIKLLHEYLNEEVNITENECEYTPIIREYSDDEIELIYSGDDVATYRVVEIDHGYGRKG